MPFILCLLQVSLQLKASVLGQPAVRETSTTCAQARIAFPEETG